MAKSLLFGILFAISSIAAWATPDEGGRIIIKNGTIYNGSTDKCFVGDILVQADTIAYVGDCSHFKADKVIDATGYIIAPGFIDPHNHLERTLLKPVDNSNESFLKQGVTTIITGVCGNSMFPIGEAMEKMTTKGIVVNCGFFVGQAEIRNSVMGKNVKRAPSPQEMEQMKALLEKSIDEGAFGLSTGLYYAPGSYSTTEEVVELSKAMSDKGGIYSTHMRSEGAKIIESVEEALRIGKEADVQVNISHIKVTKANAYKADRVIELIENAQKEGYTVTADQYPYIASGTSLRASVLPRWVEIGGRKKVVERLNNPDTLKEILPYIEKMVKSYDNGDALLVAKNADKKYLGKTITEIAKMMKLPKAETCAKLIAMSDVRVIKFSIDKKSMERFMKKPWVMTGSDSGWNTHPRTTGTYATKIQKYVLDKKLISLQDMIHRSTGMVASTYGIEKRGYLKEGYFADIIIFKPEEVKANSTFLNTTASSQGMHYVILNGNIVLEKGVYNGQLHGKVVKKKNSAKDITIFERRMNRFLKEKEIVGLIVGVVENNRMIYANSFGNRDIEGTTSFRKDLKDIVRIASISKSFCATALMQLCEQGKVSLDEDVQDIMGFKIRNPKYPDKKITVGMLLSHTSSLNDSQGYKTLDKLNPATNPNAEKCYSQYAPGDGYKYCNLNFNLLGAIVEKITGVRYDKYIKAHILDPLEMNASLNIEDLDATATVPLYKLNKKSGELEHKPEAYYRIAKADSEYIIGYDPALFSTTGGMKSDVWSLARYMMMHMNYGTYGNVKIISEPSARLMQSKQTTTDVENIFYGYALRSMDKSWVPDANLKGHTGSAYGMTSTMTFNPCEKYGFVTLCNGYKCARPSVDFDKMLYYHFIY